MRRLIIGLIFLGFGASTSLAQAPDTPWAADAATLRALEKDVTTAGLVVVGDRVKVLETALSRADAAYAAAAKGDAQTHYLLTDGLANGLAAVAAAIQSGDKRRAVGVDNPYPKIAFYLGSYYDEVGRFADAVRVLAIGLARYGPTAPSDGATFPDLGASEPLLRIEYGAASGKNGRFAEALASYDAGLAIPDLAPTFKAPMLRGRGFILTELGRLDEAEAAYRQSLSIAPDNPVALHELKYIASLHAGAKPAASELTKISPPSNPK